MDAEIEYFPATVLVHTCDGTWPMCARHAEMQTVIMKILGYQTNETPLPEPAGCENCINEFIKKRANLP